MSYPLISILGSISSLLSIFSTALVILAIVFLKELHTPFSLNVFFLSLCGFVSSLTHTIEQLIPFNYGNPNKCIVIGFLQQFFQVGLFFWDLCVAISLLLLIARTEYAQRILLRNRYGLTSSSRSSTTNNITTAASQKSTFNKLITRFILNVDQNPEDRCNNNNNRNKRRIAAASEFDDDDDDDSPPQYFHHKRSTAPGRPQSALTSGGGSGGFLCRDLLRQLTADPFLALLTIGFHLLSWGYATFDATYVLSVLPGGRAYGLAGQWCGVINEYSLLRVYMYYVPLWVIFCINITIYIAIVVVLVAGRRYQRKLDVEIAILRRRRRQLNSLSSKLAPLVIGSDNNGNSNSNSNRNRNSNNGIHHIVDLGGDEHDDHLDASTTDYHNMEDAIELQLFSSSSSDDDDDGSFGNLTPTATATTTTTTSSTTTSTQERHGQNQRDDNNNDGGDEGQGWTFLNYAHYAKPYDLEPIQRRQIVMAIAYISVFVLSYMFPSINRIYELSTGKSSPTWLTTLHELTSTRFHSWSICIIYAVTTRVVKPRSLREVLCDKLNLFYFMKYMEKALCLESLFYWFHCEKFHNLKLQGDEKRDLLVIEVQKRLVQEIYTLYIELGRAPLEINISANDRYMITTAIEELRQIEAKHKEQQQQQQQQAQSGSDASKGNGDNNNNSSSSISSYLKECLPVIQRLVVLYQGIQIEVMGYMENNDMPAFFKSKQGRMLFDDLSKRETVGQRSLFKELFAKLIQLLKRAYRRITAASRHGKANNNNNNRSSSSNNNNGTAPFTVPLELMHIIDKERTVFVEKQHAYLSSMFGGGAFSSSPSSCPSSFIWGKAGGGGGGDVDGGDNGDGTGPRDAGVVVVVVEADGQVTNNNNNNNRDSLYNNHNLYI